MSDEMTLEQALRNAIAAELAAAGFYVVLAESCSDPQAREFFELMADQERVHAERIREIGERLGAGELPDRPDTSVHSVETAVGWEGRSEITFRDAVELALGAENNAELTYETWAEQLQGDPASLFFALAADEARHALILQGVLDHSSLDELRATVTLEE